jgi:hypothetical protein
MSRFDYAEEDFAAHRRRIGRREAHDLAYPPFSHRAFDLTAKIVEELRCGREGVGSSSLAFASMPMVIGFRRFHESAASMRDGVRIVAAHKGLAVQAPRLSGSRASGRRG